jgi:uncharacterized protein YchJ
MKLAQIIEKLSTIVEHKPPVEAIILAKKNWPEFLPIITVLMDKFHEETLTEPENNLLFIGILLLVEMQQYDQFENFIKLCDGDDEYAAPLGHLLGESVTEGLSSYFYILANGRHKPLEELLLSQTCGEYIRNSALDAIFAQYESGQLPKKTLSTLIDRLLILYKEQDEFYLLGSLADLLINYQWNTYQPEMLALYNENYIESSLLSKKSIEKWHAEGQNEGVLASGLIKKELDATKEVSSWCCYQKSPVKLPTNKNYSESNLYVKTVVPGRNKPCPCGSGKKYKKCCI